LVSCTVMKALAFVFIVGIFLIGCSQQLSCTKEALICPDGTAVGRNASLNCAFNPCPEAKACTEEAKICPDGSAVARNPNNNCEFDACPGFCGSSTNAACTTDDDCMTGGCSGQVCQGINEEPIVTTCEFLECYNDEAYGVSCGCLEGKCAWN